ncbi:O-antigen ligase family protein [Nitrospira lenta]|uniref:Putative O-antigen polymerase n=1 Tax=Nitrospira lenta TaxID=1436998 RepID=A0A330L9U6_9BACT|nr:O-antigen ligase family protein [Nitrospira lenta]SPP65624.1 putative O-antigen polymerase [Nitrospira lenta]
MNIASHKMIDLARVMAIIAGVGLLYSPSVATVALIAAYVAFLFSGEAVDRFRSVLARPLGVWGMIFLGMVVVAMAYATVPWRERWMDFYKWRVILWLFVGLALFDDARWKNRFLYMFLIGTGVAVVASWFSTLSGISLWRGPQELLRNSGTQGMAFACAALICVWLTREPKHLDVPPWVWPVLAALYMANIVFITNSRSGYALLGCGLAVMLFSNASRAQAVLGVVGLCLVGGLAYLASPRMQTIVDAGVEQWVTAEQSDHLTNFGSRRVFYQNSLEVLREHWLLGVGTGGFAQAYGDHVTKKYDASDWRALRTTDPHNQYLAVWIQQGIAGLVLFLVWIAAIVRERESPRRYHQLAVAILMGWCVTSLFSSHFRTFAEGHLLATFLGVLLAVELPSVASRRDAEISRDL